MMKEAESMKKQGVFTEVDVNDIPEEQRRSIVDSRWVFRRY